MGRVVSRTVLSDREQYRTKVRRCLEALRRMVAEGRFAADELRTGVELELALVDAGMEPAMLNHAVLDRSASELLTTELGRWNLEINLPPRTLPGMAACRLEDDVVSSIGCARRSAAVVGATPVTIGILPTLGAEHLDSDQLTDDPRYDLLNRQMVDARGEPFRLDITAPRRAGSGACDERLVLDVDSIAPEAACTSLQLHLQLTPETFPAHWNAAQAVAGVQVALAANSPFLLGHRLWAETRVPLFEQAVDVRPVELRNQGVRPRVWFGDRWASSVTDLFEENVRYFPALLPMVDDEDPVDSLDEGHAPQLHELRLHSGTVWRWNRPVYDVADGVAHLRLENRVLPAGPTAIDAVANAMFFYGLVKALVDSEHPPWRSMTFDAAHDNFVAGAQHGMDAELFWPGVGTVGVDRLVLDRLLPLARQGLLSWDVEPSVAERYLAVIEARCRTGCTGASWQTQMVAALEKNGCPRPVAMRRMLERYVTHMSANIPVHAWPVM
ncbi:glutamate--cysteine ligase [Actinomycetospora endophytica]|uniref:Glutamate--cysteine ligase n=1 Tax=Actinomycetospora endophytica TaxID=2291215 RepID=A0ABS8P243_9PSEU|nr:glutamate--cysteine ligase [Actinomycetospora endophytica]MCD2192299.1 glutamate--cysteine ligase [Actinomycetospora endophytica]